jgi:tRNA uridine 5-carboxymethylaminomethyl modification enzyme
MCLDTPALMACNPSIGGVGKTHLVREVDAMGGAMAEIADRASLSFKVLNTSRGPAVQALRGVVDKVRYQALMKLTLERQPGLQLLEAEVICLHPMQGGGFTVLLNTGLEVTARAVVLATGTYLDSFIIVGSRRFRGGPHGQRAAAELSKSLRRLGFPLDRLQTATPPRVKAASVSLDQMEAVASDEITQGFAHGYGDFVQEKSMDTWLVYTDERTVEAVKDNLSESPLVLGNITDKGPRHCPSIDRKVLRFPDKGRHRIFIEPEGRISGELYLAGLSTGISVKGQKDITRSVRGMENSWISRYAYAIEYDFINPSHMNHTLESMVQANLFTAGQINGTSGYEEAAAQGLLAGINAAARALGREPRVIHRWDAYLGVMIDDLITRPLSEPYRMMPSFVEHRLRLRCDNADIRLTPLAMELGLISQQRWKKFNHYSDLISEEMERLRKWRIPASPALSRLAETVGHAFGRQLTAADLLRLDNVSYCQLEDFGYTISRTLPSSALEHIRIELKYEGYVSRHDAEIRRQKRLEAMKIPADLNLADLQGISFRARTSLAFRRPVTIGQASRYEGVSPSDVTVIIQMVEAHRRKNSGNSLSDVSPGMEENRCGNSHLPDSEVPGSHGI